MSFTVNCFAKLNFSNLQNNLKIKIHIRIQEILFLSIGTMSICTNILNVYSIFSVFSLTTFCDWNIFFFQICESKFLGTLSSLDQFVLKQVKIQGHTELTCEAQFYHHLAVHKVDLEKVLNIYIRKGIYVWKSCIYELYLTYLWTFAYALHSFIIDNGTGRIYLFKIDWSK